MTSLEELEKRKRELQLRRDIAKLERNERISNKALKVVDSAKDLTSGVSQNIVNRSAKTATWSWLWVTPLTLFGLYLVLGGLFDGLPLVILIGLLFLIPVIAKFARRS